MSAPTAPPAPRPSRPPPPANNSKGTPTAATPVTIRQPGTAIESMPWGMVLYGVEGFGKTTIGASTPSPLIIMADNETGYRTLLQAGRVADVPDVICGAWTDVMGVLDNVPAGVKTLVFDALGGIERLCLSHVCQRDFNGDWGERGFAAYGRGNEVAMADWRLFIAKLDTLRMHRKLNVLILGHSKVKTFNNPEGANYDRYQADCHEKTWGITSKWADSVLFAKFFTAVQGGSVGEGTKQGTKGKGIGAAQRIIYAEQRAAFDAKNRYGMPESFDVPNDPTQAWATIEAAMKGGAA